jgi:hypothetical protein
VRATHEWIIKKAKTKTHRKKPDDDDDTKNKTKNTSVLIFKKTWTKHTNKQ